MVRSARTFLLVALALLQSLCGVSPARSFVLCICIDGGIVLEAHGAACRCCVAEDSCCDEAEEPPLGHDDDSCSCTRFAVQGEDASVPRATPELSGSTAALELAAPWSTPTPPTPRDPRGPLDLDPDPHDPLRELRTVVLRH
jgi:hypothetical protein